VKKNKNPNQKTSITAKQSAFQQTIH